MKRIYAPRRSRNETLRYTLLLSSLLILTLNWRYVEISLERIDPPTNNWTLSPNVSMQRYLHFIFSSCSAGQLDTYREYHGCDRRLHSAVRPVLCEVKKSLQVPSSDPNLASLASVSAVESVSVDRTSCVPRWIEVGCDQLSSSSLPCKSSLKIPEFNYSTQYNCLLDVVGSGSGGGGGDGNSSRVPRVFHYVWYYKPDEKLQFHSYIGLISALQFFRPEVVFLWNDENLAGKRWSRWWQELLAAFNQPPHQRVFDLTSNSNASSNSNSSSRPRPSRRVHLFGSTKFYSVRRTRPMSIYGNAINHIQHSSDVVRLEALLLFGGLYIDSDMITVRSLDELLKYPVVMGREHDETEYSVGNAVILAERNASYLYVWHHTYVTFAIEEWAQHSTRKNHRLSKACGSYTHIEDRSLMTPSFKKHKQLYGSDVSLRENYMFHLWWRLVKNWYPKPTSPESVSNRNSTVNRIFDNLYQGLCDTNCG